MGLNLNFPVATCLIMDHVLSFFYALSPFPKVSSAFLVSLPNKLVALVSLPWCRLAEEPKLTVKKRVELKIRQNNDSPLTHQDVHIFILRICQCDTFCGKGDLVKSMKWGLARCVQSNHVDSQKQRTVPSCG